MPEPELPRPDDDAPASGAAMGRALHALTALLPALGEGSHELNITADRTDGTEASADLYVSVEPGSLRVDHSDEEFVQFFMLLTFALDNSVRDAVLVATTADAGLRACGWDVRAGWLHPMDTHEFHVAVTSCSADDPAPPVLVCHAPVLHHPHRSTGERS
ncbi:hypothetical protein OG800_49245 [Streptomyces sp. NBC_00445]|uniref:hypothetical protein n=1 Tax=Streptomyces sp. NBC_00445 TaxID=2975745 RepID=UPI002E1B725C